MNRNVSIFLPFFLVAATVSAEAGSVFTSRASTDNAFGSDSTHSRSAAVTVTSLRTEYAINPIGIDVSRPRLSWELRVPDASADRGVRQSAYEIRVATDVGGLADGTGLVWRSGKVTSDQSAHVEYDGPPLTSARRYHWRVRVWDQDGRASAWSTPAFWEMGLLDDSDWTAEWVMPAAEEDSTKPPPASMMRSGIVLDGPVVSARLYASSLGLNEVWLNGNRVGDRVMTPGWTSYDTRLQYDTYDVTDLVQSGENVLGAIIGEGWYRGRLGWEDQKDIYGDHYGLLVQLVVRYADGRTETFGTDETWKAATGPIIMSSIYDGEVYDARLEHDGWTETGFDDSAWGSVRTFERPASQLIGPAGPPVRRIEELTPIEIFETPAGDTVLDMGQNMVGWVRLRVEGPRGTTVKLRHAEVLDAEGNFYTENLRAAQASLTYTLRGDGVEVYEPHFTFMGFRYVAVEGFPGDLTPEAITGIVVHSDMRRTGFFETSNEMLNQLQQNIVWGQKGNFLDVPTDTPARDERLGWTGDAQAFAPTAAFNFDVAAFFTKWLADVEADQKPNGSVPWVVPDVLGTRGLAAGGGAAGWADVATIGPWAMYLAYGDERILEQQYSSMKRWVDFVRETAGDDLIWSETFTFGDWLSYNTTAADYPGATTDKDLIATAFFAHSTDLLARAAHVLGKHEDAEHYENLFDRIKGAFVDEYVTDTGRMASNTQTAYALALQFDLLPDGMRARAGERLAADVERFGHLTTGFLGTPHLTSALQNAGRIDLAYKLLLREDYPSWLYPITRGATTVWERWDGIKPDGTFQDVGMNSFNHYAYGAIGDWMYRIVGGLALDPEKPGYKHVVIAPQPGGGITSARATLHTMYGEASSSWKLMTSGEGDEATQRFTLTAVVPPNASATVTLPGAVLESVTEKGTPIPTGQGGRHGVEQAVQVSDAVQIKVGSGRYEFTYPVSKR